MLKVIRNALLILLLASGSARADADTLWRLLRLDDLVVLMAKEGHDYADDLAEQLYAGGGGPSWSAYASGLYDADRMIEEIEPRFEEALAAIDTEPLEQFFGSDLGRRIVDRELEARRAFLDEDVEDAAYERAEALTEEDPRRMALLEEFIQVNDLIEANVASALTYSYAFNLGLVTGDAFDGGMTEADALSDAWSQEDAMREENRRWLLAQLALAFAPLTDDEVRSYIEISRSPQGQALNGAYFTAFEPTFASIARSLGEGVARFMGGQDI